MLKQNQHFTTRIFIGQLLTIDYWHEKRLTETSRPKYDWVQPTIYSWFQIQNHSIAL